MEFPSTMLDFMHQFSDDDACRAYLEKMRWPNGFTCSRCQGTNASYVASRRLRQCATCRYQASVTAGTIFHATQTSLQKWFLAIFFLARHKQGISALQLQRDLGLGSYQTAWTMLHKIRSALGHRPAFRLTGLIEADETYLGGAVSGGLRGRGAAHKAIVAGAVERRERAAGSVRLAVVPRASKAELGPFVRGVIDANDATVRTDGWSAYDHLGEEGVDHEPTIQGDPTRAAKVLPSIHNVFSHLKTWLRGTFHGVSPKHLDRYLQEFTYRFDRRRREDELFFFVLRRALQGAPLSYSRLTAEVTG